MPSPQYPRPFRPSAAIRSFLVPRQDQPQATRVAEKKKKTDHGCHVSPWPPPSPGTNAPPPRFLTRVKKRETAKLLAPIKLPYISVAGWSPRRPSQLHSLIRHRSPFGSLLLASGAAPAVGLKSCQNQTRQAQIVSTKKLSAGATDCISDQSEPRLIEKRWGPGGHCQCALADGGRRMAKHSTRTPQATTQPMSCTIVV